MAAEIVLPAGTEYVPTADIPELIADAIQPPPLEGPTVTHLDKVAADGVLVGGRAYLEEDDTALLKEIWRDFPDWPIGKSKSEWQRYADAFERAPNKPDWSLLPFWTDLQRIAVVVRYDAVAEHKHTVIAAIRAGQLKAVSPHTRLPVNEYQPNSEVPIPRAVPNRCALGSFAV